MWSDDAGVGFEWGGGGVFVVGQGLNWDGV